MDTNSELLKLPDAILKEDNNVNVGGVDVELVVKSIGDDVVNVVLGEVVAENVSDKDLEFCVDGLKVATKVAGDIEYLKTEVKKEIGEGVKGAVGRASDAIGASEQAEGQIGGAPTQAPGVSGEVILGAGGVAVAAPNSGNLLSKASDGLDESSPGAGGESGVGTQAVVLAKQQPMDVIDGFVRELGKLAKDQNGNVYVVVSGTGNARLYRVGSTELRGLISKYLKAWGKRATKKQLHEFEEQLKADAALLDSTVTVSGRVAQKADGTVVIALHDQQNTHVEIKPGSVAVLTEGSDVLFNKAATAMPMAMPAKEGNWRLLGKYLNLTASALLLYVAWLTYTLAHAKVPGNVYVILMLIGGMGTGKSSISKAAIRLIDPSVIGVQRVPKKEQDLAIAMQSCQVAAYDNLGSLSQDMSDAFCTAATGGTVATRKLYTNDEVQVLNLHGAPVVNSIHNIASQPDFLQRTIAFRLLPMKKVDIKSEDLLLKEFEADLPVIQRGLFDLIAQVLTHLPDAVVVRPQRMHAFVRWLAAMELAHGIPMPVYQDAYAELVDECQLDGLRDNVLGNAVLDLVQTLPDGTWSGTPSELLAALNLITGYGFRHAPREWPDNEIALSKRLLPLQAALMTQSIEVISTRGKERKFTINRIAVS